MLLAKFCGDRQKPTEISSVIANLNYILNTKKGFGFWRESYGLGDYNAFRGRKKIVETLLDEIRASIGQFEPRVRLEDIREVPSESPFRLRFEMKGTFLDDARPVYIVVDALRSIVTIEGGAGAHG
ncbi:MAG: GPW/gp25 family protein [Planctomycetota bacterium]